jgi:predicted Zn-ribbon and HTH transcriptional regulator
VTAETPEADQDSSDAEPSEANPDSSATDTPEADRDSSDAEPPEADPSDIETLETPEVSIATPEMVPPMYDIVSGIGDGIDPDDVRGDVDVDDTLAVDGDVSHDVEAVRERVERIEERIAEERDTRRAVETDLAKLTQRVDAIDETLRERQSTLEDRFDEELENLEAILEYLLDTTDALEADVRAATAGREDDGRRRKTEERLADLKRTANEHGVRTGACENCGSSVDVGLLTSADCPHCEAEFVDIEPGSDWIGRLFGVETDTLVTAGDTAIELDDDGRENQ